jgi:hypothetical protein
MHFHLKCLSKFSIISVLSVPLVISLNALPVVHGQFTEMY